MDSLHLQYPGLPDLATIYGASIQDHVARRMLERVYAALDAAKLNPALPTAMQVTASTVVENGWEFIEVKIIYQLPDKPAARDWVTVTHRARLI